MSKYTIILASASPRRRELLSQIGLTFQTVSANVEEKTRSEKPWEMVEELSALKARAVLEELLKKPVLREIVEAEIFERYIILKTEEENKRLLEVLDDRGGVLCSRC